MPKYHSKFLSNFPVNKNPSPTWTIEKFRDTYIRPIGTINSEDLAYSSYPGMPEDKVREIFYSVDKNRKSDSALSYFYDDNDGINKRLKSPVHKHITEYEIVDPNYENAHSSRITPKNPGRWWDDAPRPMITSNYDGGFSKPRSYISMYESNLTPQVDKLLRSTGLDGTEIVKQHELGHALDDILKNNSLLLSRYNNLYGRSYKTWLERLKYMPDVHFDKPPESLNGISSFARALRAKAFNEGKDYLPNSKYQRNELQRVLNMNKDEFEAWFGKYKQYFKNPDAALRFRDNFRRIKRFNPETKDKSNTNSRSYEQTVLDLLPFIAQNSSSNKAFKYANFKKFKSFCT